jgi:hypothetical protein
MKTLLKLLVGLTAIGAAVVAVVFLRRKPDSWRPAMSSARDTASSWGQSAADQAGQAAEKVTATADGAADAASTVADQVKSKVRKTT